MNLSQSIVFEHVDASQVLKDYVAARLSKHDLDMLDEHAISRLENYFRKEFFYRLALHEKEAANLLACDIL